MGKEQISDRNTAFANRMKELLAFIGFAVLCFLCLTIIGIVFVGGGLLACKTASEIIRYMLPRISFIVFYSWFFIMTLQMIWDTRRYPYTELLLAAAAVIAGIGSLVWILCRLWN